MLKHQNYHLKFKTQRLKSVKSVSCNTSAEILCHIKSLLQNRHHYAYELVE